MTPEQRREHAAKLSRAWYRTPAGQQYQLIRRQRLHSPDWPIEPRTWSLEDDVKILTRIKSDRELAMQFKVSIAALRQRRVRVNRQLRAAA